MLYGFSQSGAIDLDFLLYSFLATFWLYYGYIYKNIIRVLLGIIQNILCFLFFRIGAFDVLHILRECWKPAESNTSKLYELLTYQVVHQISLLV